MKASLKIIVEISGTDEALHTFIQSAHAGLTKSYKVFYLCSHL